MIPLHWYVERNAENYKIINDYFNKGVNRKNNYSSKSDRMYFPNYRDFNGFSLGNHAGVCNNENSHLYTEITFEEFKKYILHIDNPDYSLLIFNV